jgi:FkbM family methyltransferase
MLNFTQRRAALIENRNINLVLDVGANQGQFGRSLREQCAYAGRIVSFEPLRDAFALLQQAAAHDPLWDCHNIALGDADADAIINVSANSHSSSILAVCARSLEIEPSIAYVAKEQISVRRLDGLLRGISRPEDVIYLKIDTQGYEMNVLNGALGVFNRFELIQLETSFFQVYQNELLIGDIIKFLDCLGYRVVSIEPGWEDPRTGEMLQADLTFGRK